MYLPLDKSITEFLYSLPRDSKRLASLLIKKNIKGCKKTPYSCPIANLLIQTGFENPLVCATIIDVYRSLYGHEEYTSIYTPEFILNFIKDFDLGLYPELLKQ